ncbi:hypothetical protein M8J76_010349 [Diaphorina citri]|nr:hypothetical protein M8J76_010349 [Diaphorina citri]
MESFNSCSKLIELADAHKTEDDTLIIIVNEDGTISVDPSTLQKLLASQPNQNSRLSVVSVDSATYDDPKVELTDASESSSTSTSAAHASSTSATAGDYQLADPFLDMDQEELQKLESALKSEKGRQILGENVAAMLDMLNKEGETHIAEGTHITQNIHFDHCYSANKAPSTTTPATSKPAAQTGPRTFAVKTQNVKLVQENTGSGQEQKKVLRQTTLGTQFRLVQSPGNSSQLVLQKQEPPGSTRAGGPTILQRPGVTSTVTSSTGGNVEEEMVKAIEAISTVATDKKPTLVRSHAVTKNVAPAVTPSPPLPPSKYPRRENRRPPAHLVNEAFETPLAPPSQISTPPLATYSLPKRPPQSSPAAPDQKISALDLLESIHAAVDMDVGGTHSSDDDEEEEDEDLEDFNLTSGVGTQGKLFDSPVKQPPPTPVVTPPAPPRFILPSVPVSKPSPDTTKPSIDPTPSVHLEPVTSLPEVSHATEDINVDLIEPTIGMDSSVLAEHLTSSLPTSLTDHACSSLSLDHMPSPSLAPAVSSSVSVDLPGSTIASSLNSDVHSLNASVQSLNSIAPSVQSSTNNAPALQHIVPSISTGDTSTLHESSFPSTLTSTITSPIATVTPAVHSTSPIVVVVPDSTTHPEAAPPVKHVRKQTIVSPTATISKALASSVPGSKEANSTGVTPVKSLTSFLASVTAKSEKAAAAKKSAARRDSRGKSTDSNTAAAEKKRRSSDSSRGRKSTESVAAVDDDDDMPDEDDASWNSEDDPDRLWCICQKPHNNRFMICCDSCDNWFHGKCVGITKAMGNSMEERGIEWRCPPCKEKLKTGGEAGGTPVTKATPPGVSSTNSKAGVTSTKGGLSGSPNKKSATARKPRPEPAHDPLKNM